MDERIERVLRIVSPARRTALKKLLVIGFAVPTIVSYSVKDLAFADTISDGITTVTSTPPPPTRTAT